MRVVVGGEMGSVLARLDQSVDERCIEHQRLARPGLHCSGEWVQPVQPVQVGDQGRNM